MRNFVHAPGPLLLQNVIAYHSTTTSQQSFFYHAHNTSHRRRRAHAQGVCRPSEFQACHVLRAARCVDCEHRQAGRMALIWLAILSLFHFRTGSPPLPHAALRLQRKRRFAPHGVASRTMATRRVASLQRDTSLTIRTAFPGTLALR